MHDAALAFHAAHRGAADRLMAWLAPRLDAALAATNEDAPENAATGAPNEVPRRLTAEVAVDLLDVLVG
jgi:hypothetical protein